MYDGTAFSMPIQQKLPPPVLLFSDFAGWVSTSTSAEKMPKSVSEMKDLAIYPLAIHMRNSPTNVPGSPFSALLHIPHTQSSEL